MRRPRDNTDWEMGVNQSSPVIQQPFSTAIERAKTGLRVIITKGDDGWFVARCLELPAAISQGRNKEEAIRNIEEAISLVLEDISELLEVSSNLESQWSNV